VLKAPHHLGYLPKLMQYFPDATVVHCHRDPVVIVASFCAMLYASRVTTSDHVRREAIGEYALRSYARRMKAYLRDRPAAERTNAFIDVPYQDIVRDAPAVIARCYAAAGIELDAASMSAMRDWESANRQHKHGEHRYALADFGITESEVADVFAAYSSRFAAYLQ
jgi:hypothetical protein